MAVLSTGCAPNPDRPAERRSFILLSVDTLNRSALEAFEPGAGERPVIDRFARDSARLVNAHTTTSWTLPAPPAPRPTGRRCRPSTGSRSISSTPPSGGC